MRLVREAPDKGGRILRNIVSMSHDIGIPVIVEGVETEEQAEYLQELGCECAQGYLFSKPVPIDEFEKMLDRTFRP